MGVDVPPVEEFFVVQPGDGGEVAESVAGTKEDDRSGEAGKGKEVDFVFGDEDGFDREVETGEVYLRERDVQFGGGWQDGESLVEYPESHAERFVAGAVSLAEACSSGGFGVD